MRGPTVDRVFVAALAASSALSGCEPALEIDAPHAWEGEHVVVRSDSPLDVWCAGSLRSLDLFVAEVKDVNEVPDDVVVTTYVLSDPLESYGVCPSYVSPETGEPVGGCAEDLTAYGNGIRPDHELVHAVRDAYGGTPRFFEEGAATYWARSGGMIAEDWSSLSLEDTLAASRERFMTPSEYMLAANFTAYLVHTHGRSTQAHFLREVDSDASIEAVEKAFLEVNGVSLDEAFDAYRTNWPACSLGALGLATDCAGEAIPLACNTWGNDPAPELELDITCDDPDVVGPLAGQLRRDVVLELADADAKTVFVAVRPDDSDEATTASIKACTTDCARAEPLELPTNGVPYAVLDVEPGRFLLRLTRPVDRPTHVRVSWSCRDF